MGARSERLIRPNIYTKVGAKMSWFRKTYDGQSPDAIPPHNPCNLPLRRDFGHGTKRDALPGQVGSDVGIAHIVEALPLIGIEPEQDIYLPVALPKRSNWSAGETA